MLSSAVVRFRDVGADYVRFNKVNKTTFLVRGPDGGQLRRINWSHFARDSRLDVALDDVEPLYRAMKAFDDLVNHRQCQVRHKMRPGITAHHFTMNVFIIPSCLDHAGDIVSVVNTRVMHGRTELRGKMSTRSLQCGYMDWDEIDSKIRVLKRDLAAAGPDDNC